MKHPMIAPTPIQVTQIIYWAHHSKVTPLLALAIPEITALLIMKPIYPPIIDATQPLQQANMKAPATAKDTVTTNMTQDQVLFQVKLLWI